MFHRHGGMGEIRNVLLFCLWSRLGGSGGKASIAQFIVAGRERPHVILQLLEQSQRLSVRVRPWRNGSK